MTSALADEGFDVLVSRSLEAKAEYNALHADDPLLTRIAHTEACFHPSVTPAEVFVCFLEHGGELVGSCVMRHVWCSPSFADNVESLSLLYERAEMVPDNAFAICRPTIARTLLKDTFVAMSSGGHIRRDFRKSLGYEGLWRLARLKSLVEWRWSYAVTLMEPDTAQKIGFRRYAYDLASGGVLIHDGECEHEYLLYVSERERVRDILGQPGVGDLSRALAEFTAADIAIARSRRGIARAAE